MPPLHAMAARAILTVELESFGFKVLQMRDRSVHVQAPSLDDYERLQSALFTINNKLSRTSYRDFKAEVGPTLQVGKLWGWRVKF